MTFASEALVAYRVQSSSMRNKGRIKEKTRWLSVKIEKIIKLNFFIASNIIAYIIVY